MQTALSPEWAHECTQTHTLARAYIGMSRVQKKQYKHTQTHTHTLRHM